MRLYLVTDPVLVPAGRLVETVLAAVRGGVTMVQVRDKTGPPDDVATQVEALLRHLRPRGVPVLVNDLVDVAARTGADGVHLGQGDGDPRTARARLGPHAVIGLSIASDAELDAAPLDAIDYLGLSPVFATATKPDHDPPLGLEGARRLVQRTHRPCVGIGGIDAARAAHVFATGVAGIAVVSAICAAADPERAARDILRGEQS